MSHLIHDIIWNSYWIILFSSSEHCHLPTLLLTIVTNKVLPITHFCKTASLSEQPGVGWLWWGMVEFLLLLSIITIFICWQIHAVMSFYTVHLSLIPHLMCPTQPHISCPVLISESSPFWITAITSYFSSVCSMVGLVSSNFTIRCVDHHCSEKRVIKKSTYLVIYLFMQHIHVASSFDSSHMPISIPNPAPYYWSLLFLPLPDYFVISLTISFISPSIHQKTSILTIRRITTLSSNSFTSSPNSSITKSDLSWLRLTRVLTPTGLMGYMTSKTQA